MNYLLYNTKADGGQGEKGAQEALTHLKDTFEAKASNDIDLAAFYKTLKEEDKVVILGGDGTLNYFINHVDIDHLPCSFFLYPSGTGNDFAKDTVAPDEQGLIPLNDYFTNLPYVDINGKTYRFINGIGYGIDGQCCEVADQKNARGEKVDYSSITVGLLFKGYKPRNATVTVDGQTSTYKKVYLASGMHGRYYGGGMMIAPAQQRNGGSLSCVVIHGKGKLGTLMLFPKLFSGKHVKAKKAVSIVEGKRIQVSFDVPCALQVDGETFLNVSEYVAYLK